MGRLSRDKRDIFYRLAKEKGYRARSAFKLLQIDSEFGIFENVRRAVDLAAAPGSWSQVLADELYDDADEEEKEHGKRESANDTQSTREEAVSDSDTPSSSSSPITNIIAVDLQPMAPIEGVTCLQGDITNIETAQRIIDHFQGVRAELVVCDGAPDVTGLHDIDEYLQSQLLLAAMLITTHVLCQGGTMVAKIFRGSNVPFLYAQLRCLFHKVTIAKPTSSRNSSMEAFVVCQQFKGEPYFNLPLDAGGLVNLVNVIDEEGDDDERKSNNNSNNKNSYEPTLIPFLSCGDLTPWSDATDRYGILDSDKSYPIDESVEYIPPIAPPIDPPYQESIQLQKEERRKRG